jgi:uncharacterized membrane protein
MGLLYILAGLNHFRKPKMYERIIPAALPAPKVLNFLSGVAEVVFGLLLMLPQYSSMAAWGIIALLIAVFPANIYMAVNKKAGFGLPLWVLYLRLPLQLVLIYWAWLYT